ncbi:MAG: Arm DNA-binding domain-containing protein [Pseudohaliea sp.]
MGTINARHGKLYLDFRYRGVRCREQTNLEDKPAHRKRMKTLMRRIESEITLGSFDYAAYFPDSPNARRFAEHDTQIERRAAKTPLFKEFAKQWMEENRIGWKPSYIDTLEHSLNRHVLPAFGDVPVSAITKEEILAFRNQLARIPRKNGSVGLSPARINTVMVPLRQVLQEASERFGFDNPYKGIKLLKVPRTKVEPFTLDEVKAILDHVREDFHPYMTTRFFTGMRTGEIHGLKWKNVDFRRRLILVRESYVAGAMTDTKTEESARDIVMTDEVHSALKAQRKRTGRFEFVFCTDNGDPLSISNVCNRVWYPLLRLLNIPPRPPYHTRHTAATLWLAAGENPLWVAQMLGHTDSALTHKRYARWIPNLTRRDGSAFAALWAAHTAKASESPGNIEEGEKE